MTITELKDIVVIAGFVIATISLAFTAVNPAEIALPFGVLLALILLVIPAVLMIALSLLGFRKRTSFLTAITLTQVSEFSLILVKEATSKGLVSPEFFNIVILLALVTITITAYVVKYDEKLYALIGRRLGFLEKLALFSRNNYEFPMEKDPRIILIGYDRIGFSILKKLRKMKKPTIVVDINPDIIKKLINDKVPCMYGDIGDIEILERLKLEKIETIISTIPGYNDTMLMIESVRKRNAAATIIVTAYDGDEAMALYDAGADYVIVPHFLGGEHLSVILDELTGSVGKRIKIKVAHQKALKERKKRSETG